MSGRRQRAIKATFLKDHGRLPVRASWNAGVVVQENELRRAKKDYMRRARP